MCFDILLTSTGLTTILVVIVLTLLWLSIRRPSDFPPGPPVHIPIVGNMLEFRPSNILQKFRNYRHQYGDVFSLKMGSRWWIILNGYDTLKEALVKNADSFSSRPDIFLFREFAQFKGVIASSGSLWKEHRTFALNKLRSFGFGKRSIETNILQEVEVLVKYMEEQNSKSFDINNVLHACVSNVTCSIVFGKQFSHTDPAFLKILDMFQENLQVSHGAAVMTWMPFLKYLPFDYFKFKKTFGNIKTIESFLNTIIDEHWRTYQEDNMRDYIDTFIAERKRRGDDATSTFTDYQLTRTILEFFLAGTETTTATIRWGIVYLILNPDIQTKMRKEIESLVGSAQLPRMQHRQDMPYTEAVLAETQRCGDIVPLSLFHGVEKEVIFKGYRIPKDAVITPNLDSVMFDPKEFADPFTFNPKRFLDENGKLCNTEKVVPFSLGRRVCLGESLARMELFLILTGVVQRFELLPDGENLPSLDPIIGATRSPKPFTFRAVPIY